MAVARRKLHVARAASTVMARRVERTAATALVMMPMSGPGALGARCVMVAVSLGLILLQHN